MVSSTFADTTAIGLIERIIESTAGRQGPAPSGSSVVITISTKPAVMSAADGVNVAASKVALSNVPVPPVVHVTEVAPLPMVPDNK